MTWIIVLVSLLLTLGALGGLVALTSDEPRPPHPDDEESLQRAERIWYLRRANAILSEQGDKVQVKDIYELADLLKVADEEGLTSGTDQVG